MKKIISLYFGFFIFSFSYSQRIVNSILINDIDEYPQNDSLMSLYKLYSVNLFSCPGNQPNSDSCVLYCEKGYNEKGSLVYLKKGDNLSEAKVDYFIKYRQISDSSFETITMYPANSTKVAEYLYLDTIIKGKAVRSCLYKKDKEQNIFIRSLYRINNDGTIIDIKRFDFDGNLVQIFYPFGSRKPLKEWADTLIGEIYKTIIFNAVYVENDYKSIKVYNKNGRLLENSFYNTTFNNGFKAITKQIIIYDNHNNPIRRNIIDENNELVSEEKYFYKNKILVKYERYEGSQDSNMTEKHLYDSAGRIILKLTHHLYSENTTSWEYYYNDKGLSTKDVYYLNSELRATRLYKYK